MILHRVKVWLFASIRSVILYQTKWELMFIVIIIDLIQSEKTYNETTPNGTAIYNINTFNRSTLTVDLLCRFISVIH